MGHRTRAMRYITANKTTEFKNDHVIITTPISRI